MTPCTRVIQMDSWLNAYAKEWKKENLEKFINLLRSEAILKTCIDESFCNNFV